MVFPKGTPDLLRYYRKLSPSYTQRARALSAQDIRPPATILATAAHRLEHIGPDMSTRYVQQKIDDLCYWLLTQKIGLLAGKYRRRRMSDSAWLTDVALSQIDQVITDVRQPWTGQEISFQAQHGSAFAVFHCRDARRCSLEESLQRWQGTWREQWYVSVALVMLNTSSLVVQQPLSCVFEVTNHIDCPWPRQREIRWSLDRRLLSPDAKVDACEHVYPRSTCAGDVFVSLLSNVAWVVKRPSGFHRVNEEV